MDQRLKCVLSIRIIFTFQNPKTSFFYIRISASILADAENVPELEN